MFNSTNHGHCFNVTFVSDGLVEGTEIIMLCLEQNLMSSGTFGIRDVIPKSVNITVQDTDCVLLNFIWQLHNRQLPRHTYSLA